MRLATLGKGDPSAHLRPTPDRVRESLFSMLVHRNVLDNARVLDLFAGTGALGLEENGRTGQRLIAENISKLGAQKQTRLIRADATRKKLADQETFDLVFLDPPYGKALGELALANLRHCLTPDALVIWEESAFKSPPDGYALVDQRKFGEAHLTLLTRSDEANS
jgi:16S rRNA (guanine966-N2)-methyltransferase